MTEETNIAELIKAARLLEDYLWGEHNKKWGLEEWKRMMRKRLLKLEQVDMSKPHWDVEFRKRLLQTASVAVACMTAMDNDKIGSEANPPELMSNLPDYAKMNTNIGLALRSLNNLKITLKEEYYSLNQAVIFLEEIHSEFR